MEAIMINQQNADKNRLFSILKKGHVLDYQVILCWNCEDRVLGEVEDWLDMGSTDGACEGCGHKEGK